MAEKKQKKKLFQRIGDIADIITAVGVIGAAAVGIGTWCVHQIMSETNGKIDSLADQVKSIELNSTRNQLLTLISNYPNNEEEILKVGRYYFKELNGDWYMTSLFSKWATQHGIDITGIVKIKGD